MTQYLTRQQFSNAKRRLTTLQNKLQKVSPEGNYALPLRDKHDPRISVFQKIVAEVDRTFQEWDDGGFAYPDDWHRWNVARDDALWALRLAR